MRRNEIDWIRNISVLVLFLFHTSSVFTYYEPWYIWAENKSWLATIFFIVCIPWHMPVLFFLAGASTQFSLSNRGGKKYIWERVNRLLIPFVLGMLILVPPQGYFARVSRGKYVGSYLEQWKYFWTTISDIPYDGGLGPAHLWFILYLFIISLIGLVIIKSLKKTEARICLEKLKKKLTGKNSLAFAILILFSADSIPLAIAKKNILVFLIVFLMGYIVYNDSDYLDYIDKNKKKGLIIALILFIFYIAVILHYYSLNANESIMLKFTISLFRNGIMVTMIVSIIGYGRKYLNRAGKILSYLNKACFPIYILHQTVIVITAYYLLSYELPTYVSFITIIAGSTLITFVIYEIMKRIKIMRYLIGIK